MPPVRRAAETQSLRWIPLAILLLGVAVRWAWPHSLPRTPDEEFFTTYARDVAAEGPGLVGRFTAYCLEHPERGLFPWPQRAGYVWIAGGLMALTGDDSMWLLIGLSTVASVLVLALAGTLALRFGDAWSASATLLALAFSPLDLAVSRRVWQDDVLALFTTGMLAALAFAAARPRRRLPALLFFGLGAIALTVKETALPVLVAGGAFLATRRARDGQGPRAVAFAVAGTAAAAALAATVLTVAAGGLPVIGRLAALARVVNVPNEYMRAYQSGSPLYYAEGLLRLQPVAFALAALAAALALAGRWPGPERLRARMAPMCGPAAWILVGMALAASLYPQKNLRFLSPLYAPAALLAGALLRSAFAAATARLAPARARAAAVALAAVLVLVAAGDLARYHHWFVVRAVPDLATPWFRPQLP